MKRGIAFTLIFIMVFSSVSIAATEKNKLDFTTVVDIMNMKVDCYNIFDLDMNDISAKENLSIKYDYIFTPIDSNHVSLDISGNISVSNEKHYFKANGIIEKYTLETDESVFYGSADGKININGKEYNLTVGFDKKNSNEFITTTIYDKAYQTVLVFGKPVVSKNEKDKIAKTKKNNINAKSYETPYNISGDVSIMSVDYINDFSYVRSETGNLYNSAGNDTGYRGVYLRLYKSDITETGPALQIRVTSYNDSLYTNLKADNPYVYEVELNQIKVSLDMSKGTCYGEHPGEGDEGSGILKSILYDALGYYGVPTSTLDSIFSSMSGGVDVYHSIYEPSITITGDYGDRIDCDSDFLPLFFGVLPASSGAIDGSFDGDLKYRITTNTPGVGLFSFYQHATASDSISTTF